jgi:hypothetical protein
MEFAPFVPLGIYTGPDMRNQTLKFMQAGAFARGAARNSRLLSDHLSTTEAAWRALRIT